jgi:hypothetical protein
MRTGIGCFLGILVVLYLGIGLAFHARWQRTLQVCRQARVAQGAFVEPEWSPLLTAAFDVTFWPVYAWANAYHDGWVFPTCPE